MVLKIILVKSLAELADATFQKGRALPQRFSVILCIAANIAISAQAGNEALVECDGFSIQLPSSWTDVNQPTNFFVQKRAASPKTNQFVSLGSFLIPGLSFEEYTLLGLKGIDQGIYSSAKKLGFTESEVDKLFASIAGREMLSRLKQQNSTYNITANKVQSLELNGRKAIEIDGEIDFLGTRVPFQQLGIQGYSPGEIIQVSLAGSDPVSTFDLKSKIKLYDTRVIESRFLGFLIRLPRGSVTKQFENTEASTKALYQYPVGPRGEGLAQIVWLKNDENKTVNDLLSASSSSLRAKTKQFKELKSESWNNTTLSFGNCESEFIPPQNVIGDNAIRQITCVVNNTKSKTMILLTINFPPFAAACFHTIAKGILESIETPER